MTEENNVVEGSYDPQLLNNAFEQGYKQGWIHSQQALSEWVIDMGKVDAENASFYSEFGQIIARLEIVKDVDVATPDVSEVSQYQGNDNDSAGV
jgi:hypothetical protein